MPQPDLDVIVKNWWGGGYDSTAFAGISAASNVIIGTNPAYSSSDFLAVYPKFTDLVPGAVLTMFVNLATACLMKARWQDQWKFAMALFIAHYCTLYLQSEGNPGSTAATVAASGLAKGVLVSKSAGDVSASMETLVGDWASWGAWVLTSYGQQLMTQAKMIGFGIMYIR